MRGSGYIAERTGEGMMEKMKKTVRQAARDREPLNGTDAQALEGALQQAEREIAALRVLLRECRDDFMRIKDIVGLPNSEHTVRDIAVECMQKLNAALGPK